MPGRGPGRAGEAFWPYLHTETAAEALEGHFLRAGELQEVREGVARTRGTGMTCGRTALSIRGSAPSPAAPDLAVFA